MQALKLIFIAVPLMFVLDLLWIGGAMSEFYKNSLRSFLRFNEVGALSPRIIPTIIVYIVGAILITIFVLPKVWSYMSLGFNVYHASLWGALLGFLIYSFYDFTNFALFEKWTLSLSVVDILWGTLLFYITTVILALI